MDKINYYLKQFKRTWNKQYENYCIERIIHKIDNSDLQFVTQQMFRRKEENRRAFSDLYFPQLKLSIEIDENHHLTQKEKDELRKEDILNAIKKQEITLDFEPEELRIDVSKTKTLEEINKQIDNVIDGMLTRIKKIKTPLKWEIGYPDYKDFIEIGYIMDDGSCYFKYINEASWLFGKNYKAKSRLSYFNTNKGYYVWLPKLKIEGFNYSCKYLNEISDDGNIIKESSSTNNVEFVKKVNQTEKRLIFAYYYLPSICDYAYVFKGVYELDPIQTKKENKRVWKKNINESKKFNIKSF